MRGHPERAAGARRAKGPNRVDGQLRRRWPGHHRRVERVSARATAGVRYPRCCRRAPRFRSWRRRRSDVRRPQQPISERGGGASSPRSPEPGYPRCRGGARGASPRCRVNQRRDGPAGVVTIRSRSPMPSTDHVFERRTTQAAGRGEFATAAMDRRRVWRAAMAPLPSRRWGRPRRGDVRTLWRSRMTTARGLKVKLPATPEPGRRYWIAFDKPHARHCLSLAIVDASPRSRAAGPAVLAEVEAYTDLDFSGGIERVVQDRHRRAPTATPRAC